MLDPFCGETNFIDHEMDGMPLIGPGFQPNRQWLANASSYAEVVAAAYMFNLNIPALNGRPTTGLLHFSGLLVETKYGSEGGGFLSLGSMGAYRIASSTNPTCAHIFSNMIGYLTGNRWRSASH